MKVAQPYVGITGITTPEEVEAVIGDFAATGFSPEQSHTGMIGFALNHRAIREHWDPGKRYLRQEKRLGELVAQVRGRALPMLHYTPARPRAFARDLIPLLRDAPACRAVQCNHPFPDIQELRKLKERCPDLAIVFSVYETLLRAGHAAMAQRIRECRGAIAYVLLDPSQGNGRNLDLQKAVEAYRVIVDAAPEVTVGFAGGFSGENAEERIATLRGAVGNARFSIDAEGKLRTAADELDPANIRAYLQAAQRGFAMDAASGS